MRIARVLLLLLAAAISVSAAERLTMAYFHDEDKSTLSIRDLAFADAERGMAVGWLAEDGKLKGAGLVTADAGRTWTIIKLPAPAMWLFLDGRAGWIGDGRRVWKTVDFGRSWRRVARLDNILRVFFLDERRGWAAGANKSILETDDGGEHWRGVEAAKRIATTREFTAFTWVAFADARHGFIIGMSRPPRRRALNVPDWMDPEFRQRELPSTMLLLETQDGGKTWRESVASAFGQVTRVRLTAEARGLALIEFRGEFPFASEVLSLDLKTGKSERVFREKNRVVTDLVLVDGEAWLAAVEPAGAMLQSPVPGKLKLLRSTDLAKWTEVPVDYRAVARRAMCARGAGRLWVATDTGMILSLEKP